MRANTGHLHFRCCGSSRQSARVTGRKSPPRLVLVFENERIIVMPDDVLVKSDGKRTFRRVKTGHHRDSHAEDLDSATLIMAAKEAFPDATVELVYLSDRRAETYQYDRAKNSATAKRILVCSSKAFGWVSFQRSHLHIPAQLACVFRLRLNAPRGFDPKHSKKDYRSGQAPAIQSLNGGCLTRLIQFNQSITPYECEYSVRMRGCWRCPA